jgi:hypothetical protein
LVAWTSPALGWPPSVPSKLCSVVKVRAGRTTAVAAQSTKTAYTIFPQFSLANSLTIRFIDVFLFF